MTDVAATQGDEGVAEGAAAGPGVDISPVLEQIEALGSRFGEFESRWNESQTPAEDEQVDADGYDGELGQLSMVDGEIDEESAQRFLQGLVQKQTGTELEKALAPVLQQLGEIRAENDAKSLLEEFPQLGDPKVQEAVVGRAQELARELGLSPDLAMSKGFISLVFKANRADQTAAGEVPVGDLQQHGLEGAAGATPGGQQGPSLAEQITGARGERNSFWGT